MTYNVLMETLNPAYLLTHAASASDLPNAHRSGMATASSYSVVKVRGVRGLTPLLPFEPPAIV